MFLVLQVANSSNEHSRNTACNHTVRFLSIVLLDLENSRMYLNSEQCLHKNTFDLLQLYLLISRMPHTVLNVGNRMDNYII